MCEAHNHADTSTAAATSASGVTFHVSDMTCGHCAGVIRSALEQTLPGSEIAIDISAARVTVDGDEAAAADAIRQAGYSPERVN
ncbi:heavy-metal-associated domain-containing protein [Pelagibacterium sp.]|uniref:heavy-metal-associated domain-containing protein n=1 Tax=Pelagibacterium sp. TaxID=1967288 RepID=UPI003BAD3291